jgi:N-acyl-D-amino-acid deacylase
VSFNMHEDDVRTLMAQPWTMTASDGDLVPFGEGVPHPRSYGTFPRKIRHYVLEEGVVDLAFAIRSMTSLPARVFRMDDRGVLVPGAVADVVVFDLDRLRDVGTFDDPHHLAEGMIHVFVNGEAALRDGSFTGVLAGRVLLR